MRKILGCVTLVAALVFLAGWIRSETIQDIFILPNPKSSTFRIVSLQRSIVLYFAEVPSKVQGLHVWESSPVFINSRWSSFYDAPNIKWHWKQQKFGLGEMQMGLADESKVVLLAVPYWSMVSPMAILSALLLWPRRKLNSSNNTPVETV